jgi:hypothetical protein
MNFTRLALGSKYLLTLVLDRVQLLARIDCMVLGLLVELLERLVESQVHVEEVDRAVRLIEQTVCIARSAKN